MARHAVNSGDYTRAPAMAERLLALSAGGIDEAPILGDLQEQYLEKRLHAERSARAWYWREVATAAPQLLWRRMKRINFRMAAIGLAATIAAYIAITLWGVYVARPVAYALNGANTGLSIEMIRIVYLIVQMIGGALCAALIAYKTFQAKFSFIQNFFRRLGPLALLLFAPPVFTMLFSADDYAVGFRLLSLSLSGASLAAGAFAGASLAKGR